MKQDVFSQVPKLGKVFQMVSYRFVSKKGFSSFVKGLLGAYKRVFGPVKKDGFPAFGPIKSPADLALDAPPTHISARGFLFPREETLLEFNIKEGTHKPVVEAEDQVLIGLHPCDIHGVNLLDRVFEYGTPDANYLKRREKTIIIGTECMPDDYCFCSSVNTMKVDSGFDVFAHEIKRGYLLRTATDRGRRLLKRFADTRRATGKEIEEMEERERVKEDSFKTRLDADADSLPLIYSGAYDSPVWDRIGAVCYGCGSCNLVCPTCYCFDIKETVSMDLSEGRRVRVWDGCLLEDFAKVAGGHNFRKRRAERLRHRFLRKFQYQRERFGGLFCVGCGRCSRTCLVNINIAGVTNEVIRGSFG